MKKNMMKSETLSWSFNLWISYMPPALFILFVDWKTFLAFSLGAIGSQLSLNLMMEDAEKIRSGRVKAIKFGFLKRYILSAIIFLFSSIFGIKGLIFAFFGLELARLTLTTYLGSGET
jgi:hypothetical protein